MGRWNAFVAHFVFFLVTTMPLDFSYEKNGRRLRGKRVKKKVDIEKKLT